MAWGYIGSITIERWDTHSACDYNTVVAFGVNAAKGKTWVSDTVMAFQDR